MRSPRADALVTLIVFVTYEPLTRKCLGESDVDQACSEMDENGMCVVTPSPEFNYVTNLDGGESVVIGCGWESSCVTQPHTIEVKWGPKEVFTVSEAGTGWQRGSKISVFYNMNNCSRSYLQMTIYKFSCQDMKTVRCRAFSFGIDRHSDVMHDLAHRDHGELSLRVVEPPSLSGVFRGIQMIKLRCAVDACSTNLILAWRSLRVKVQRAIPHQWSSQTIKDYSPTSERRLFLWTITSELIVPQQNISQFENVSFICLVDKHQYQDEIIATEVLTLKDCQLNLWSHSTKLNVYDDLIFTWNNTCPDIPLTWTINTSAPEDYKFKPAIVKTDPLEEATGNINVFVTEDPSLKELTLTLGISYSGNGHSAQTAEVSVLVLIPLCQLSVVCHNVSTVHIKETAVLHCHWTNTCPDRPWDWILKTNTGQFLDPSHLVQNSTQASSSSLTTASGNIEVKFRNMSCKTLRVKICCAYREKIGTRSYKTEVTIVLNTFESLAALSEPLKFIRATPPLKLFSEGVKELSNITLTCSGPTNGDIPSVSWLVLGANDLRHPIRNRATIQTSGVAFSYPGDRVCQKHWESTLSVILMKTDVSVRILCYLDEAVNVSAEACFSPSCISTTLVDVHFPIDLQTASLTVSPPRPRLHDTVTLTCCGNGHPRPRFDWLTTSALSFYGLPPSRSAGSCSVLELKNVKRNITGVFSCVMSNSVFGEHSMIRKDISLQMEAHNLSHDFRNKTGFPGSTDNHTHLHKDSHEEEEHPTTIVLLTIGVLLLTLVLLAVIVLLVIFHEQKEHPEAS